MSGRSTVDLLRRFGIPLRPGLSTEELDQAQETYQVRFGTAHRELLSIALPSGPDWYDWRQLRSERIRAAIRQPFEGVLFDVETNGFWPKSWGDRPGDEEARRANAELRMSEWPQLVRLYGHRYLPGAPHGDRVPAPILSVYQTDVIIYGHDLPNYVLHEFGPRGSADATRIRAQDLEPWTLLAIGEEIA